MKLSDFDYDLPKNLIAQEPMKPRDRSRLLVLNRKTGKIEHKIFIDILDYLNPGDILVLNNSKVMPARLIGQKKMTGGKIEVFLLHEIENGRWQCLIGGRGAKAGLEIEFKNLNCEVLRDNGDGTWEVKFDKIGKEFMRIVEKIGLIPLPPYIKRQPTPNEVADTVDYQTVYAEDKKIGSVAAPTAGLHFTPALLKKIKAKGVRIEFVTLHVGLGTFMPVKTDNVKKHKMHSEWIEADKETISNIYQAKAEDRRIVAVGTTSARVLESIASKLPITNYQLPCLRQGFGGQANKFQPLTSDFRQFADFKDNTDIFIYPGYKFKIVDALITNFHLPKSTLLMLVSALAGRELIKKTYKEAVREKYRFFSYGDAMLIIDN